MKTKLPESITTVEEAKAYLRELYKNDEAYHCEDRARDCFRTSNQSEYSTEACVVTDEQAIHMDMLMEQIYTLPGNDGRHVEPMVFDPCGFILGLEHEGKEFLWTDQSGRGEKPSTCLFENLVDDDCDETSYDDESLQDWIREAEVGDEWENSTDHYVRTK